MLVSINDENINEVVDSLSKLVKSIEPDRFLDPELYPPTSASRRTVFQYFLVMVAMDHRLSRPGRPYEGYVEGKLYHGADLLYRLGVKKLKEDLDFFEPRRLATISIKDVKEWLTLHNDKASPPDPDIRAELLKDLGVKLLKLYDGDPILLLTESRGFLKNRGSGLIEILKVFKAYNDPVEKKAYLLAKFIERREVMSFLDPQNKEVPVDNHLVRIALRLGLVDVDSTFLEKIAYGIEVSEDEDVLLRFATRTAYKKLISKVGVDPFVLDDFLWNFGRKVCRRESPVCKSGEGCPLAPTCRANSNPLYMVPEHKYLETWWY
ncbi:MAG: hypothetical protein QXV55_02865 [Acidilobaceae archaeon]